LMKIYPLNHNTFKIVDVIFEFGQIYTD